jgi:ferrous iron transport protein A
VEKQTLDTLLIGQKAKIDSFTDDILQVKLLEMGCVPGENVHVSLVAPFGDPIAINISGYTLSLRRSEASAIVVAPLEE